MTEWIQLHTDVRATRGIVESWFEFVPPLCEHYDKEEQRCDGPTDTLACVAGDGCALSDIRAYLARPDTHEES